MSEKKGTYFISSVLSFAVIVGGAVGLVYFGIVHLLGA